MMESHVLAEDMIRRGTKLQPSRGKNIWDFYASLTHLHLENQGLTGGIEPLKLCVRLRVLYLYDNQLTSLSGVEKLHELTHLFAQNNKIVDLDDFIAPSTLIQLFLGGNELGIVDGLHAASGLRELRLGGQRVSGMELGISFAPESLYCLSHSLQTLDLSNCSLAVSHLEVRRPYACRPYSWLPPCCRHHFHLPPQPQQHHPQPQRLSQPVRCHCRCRRLNVISLQVLLRHCRCDHFRPLQPHVDPCCECGRPNVPLKSHSYMQGRRRLTEFPSLLPQPLVVLQSLVAFDLSRSCITLSVRGPAASTSPDVASPISQADSSSSGDVSPPAAPSVLSLLLRVLSRLPRLRTLRLKGNEVMGEPKSRERIVLGCQALEELDGRGIGPNERRFLQSLVMRQQVASLYQLCCSSQPVSSSPLLSAFDPFVWHHFLPNTSLPAPILSCFAPCPDPAYRTCPAFYLQVTQQPVGGRTQRTATSAGSSRERHAAAGAQLSAERGQAGACGIRRGVSIQTIANFEISWKGLDGEVPAGLIPSSDGAPVPASAALPTGARRSWVRAPPVRMAGL